MAISVGMVCSLFVWCMAKVMCAPEDADHMHGILDDTPDHDEKQD
ncbi:hypothetical protein [Rubellicoccus peritrichatus]|uniref:Uncharacterized protein n=1 Tax=Rubellicoccus peritrichatus TaxID=3080537 RepID=A0AAQ3L6C6_9BACT|nr:hypothetical protein [Puniceicoccus sp. CR14]WOO39786.1 hypothetical protein RZN69_14270 [Puniceicoccus sp. CR14]